MPKLRLVPTLALLLLLAGCGASNSPVLPTFGPDGPGSLIFWDELGGELAVEDRCLYLIDEDEVKWLPVFEDGSVSWESDMLVLDSQRFAVGQRVAVGGGDIHNLRNLQVLQEPDDSCDMQNLWLALPLSARPPIPHHRP